MSEKASVFYLLSFIKDNGKIIFKGGLIGAAVGVIFALFTPSEYRVEVGFISEKKTSTFPGLSGLPGLSALDLGSPSDNINSELYINIIQSPQFIRELQQETFNSEDHGELRLIDYSLNYEKTSLARSIISLPSTIRSFLRRLGTEDPVVEPTVDSTVDQTVYVERLTNGERILLTYVSENVEFVLDKGTGLIKLTVFHQDRRIVAELAHYIYENLKRALSDMQGEKAKRKYDFIDLQYEQALNKFNDIQSKLASFRDRNRNVSTAMARTQEERLVMDFNIASNVLNTLAVKREEAKISYEEGIPMFTVINPVILPRNAIKRPGPMLTIALFTFLAVSITFAVVFYKTHLQKYLHNDDF
jgi:uncharacterized protein involved in exopolysaccharide biosynthesis